MDNYSYAAERRKCRGMQIEEFPQDVHGQQILAAMIFNDQVLARVAPKWKYGFFGDSIRNSIAEKVVDYFRASNKMTLLVCG